MTEAGDHAQEFAAGNTATGHSTAPTHHAFGFGISIAVAT
jgi:hypothetical protein